jgi:hypothetical protein
LDEKRGDVGEGNENEKGIRVEEMGSGGRVQGRREETRKSRDPALQATVEERAR